MPNCVFVWDNSRLRQAAVLQQLTPVRALVPTSALALATTPCVTHVVYFTIYTPPCCEVTSQAWHPRSCVLAIAAGSSHVYLWSLAGASCVPVPSEGSPPLHRC